VLDSPLSRCDHRANPKAITARCGYRRRRCLTRR
jgi:hypothetical protein